jgi:hypothetical protein
MAACKQLAWEMLGSTFPPAELLSHFYQAGEFHPWVHLVIVTSSVASAKAVAKQVK